MSYIIWDRLHDQFYSNSGNNTVIIQSAFEFGSLKEAKDEAKKLMEDGYLSSYVLILKKECQIEKITETITSFKES